MKTIYHYIADKDHYVLTNTRDHSCIACLSTCSQENELHKCNVFRETRRRGFIQLKGGSLYICTNEAIKSSRQFREKQTVFGDALEQINKDRNQVSANMSQDVSRLIHNLVSLNAQTLQAIYSIIPQESFQSETHDALLEIVTKKIEINPERFASLITRLAKIESHVKTEFSVFAKLYLDEPITKFSYPIHKIVLLVLNFFWTEFKELNIKLEIGTCYQKVYVDYETVAAIFFHLLDNTTKYIQPGSTLRVKFQHVNNFVRVSLDMISLKVEASEYEAIFTEGYRGLIPRNLDKPGRGIGLYLIQRLITLTGGSVKFTPNADPSLKIHYRGWDFENNIFTVELPLCKDSTSSNIKGRILRP
jgi:signal transduction histidine kinase